MNWLLTQESIFDSDKDNSDSVVPEALHKHGGLGSMRVELHYILAKHALNNAPKCGYRFAPNHPTSRISDFLSELPIICTARGVLDAVPGNKIAILHSYYAT